MHTDALLWCRMEAFSRHSVSVIGLAYFLSSQDSRPRSTLMHIRVAHAWCYLPMTHAQEIFCDNLDNDDLVFLTHPWERGVLDHSFQLPLFVRKSPCFLFPAPTDHPQSFVFFEMSSQKAVGVIH